MIGTVLEELKDSAVAQLPACIDRISSIRSVSLDNSFTFIDWWKLQSEALTLSFPAFGLGWRDTSTGQRNGVRARKGKHRVLATYTVRAADENYIRRHMLYVPEAILLWLDELPSASRPPGSGLTITGLDRADEEEIEIAHDVEAINAGFFIWSVDVAFTVLAVDENLPNRSTPPTS